MTTLASRRSGRALVPGGWWPVAVLLWLLACVVLAGLAWHLHRTGSGGRLDAGLDPRVAWRLAGHRQLMDALTFFGSPVAVVGGSVALAAWCLSARWWRGAGFALLAAPLAGVTTELVLKPYVAQHVVPAYRYAFPSGHATGAFGLALVASVLLLPDRGARLMPVLGRVLLGTAALVIAAGTAVAVVALGWHHATDAVGGAATAVVVVLGTAAVVEAAGGARRLLP